MPTFVYGPRIGWPSMRISPLDGSISPAIMDNSVLLPHPLGPRSDTNSLAPISKSTRSTASVVEPSRATKDFEMPPSSMNAVRSWSSIVLAARNTVCGAYWRLGQMILLHSKARSSAQLRRACHRLDEHAWTQGRRKHFESDWAKCVAHGIGDNYGRCNRAALAQALDPECIQRRGRLSVDDLYRRHVCGRRDEIIGERPGQELCVAVVDHLLEQRPAQPLADAIQDLALGEFGIDENASVMDDHILLDRRHSGGAIKLDNRGVCSVRPSDGRRFEIRGRLQPGCHARGPAMIPAWPCGLRDLLEGYAQTRHAADDRAAVTQLKIVCIALEHVARDRQHLAPQFLARERDRGGWIDRAAACNCAVTEGDRS